MPRRIIARAASLASLLAVAACGILPGLSKPEAITDGNILAIFLAANNTDISYAQVALTPGRTETAAVRNFATRMLTDHTALNRSALDLAAEHRITPRENTTSLDFRDESAAKRDTLREQTGALFDSTYMANEVRYHQRLLAALDSVLIPNARHAELKTMLTRVRPAVSAHLEHAIRIQGEIRR